MAADKQPDHTNPRHYRQHPSGIEFIEVGRHMNFNLGNVLKYIWRADLKHGDGGVADLEKAAWYLRDEIARRQGAASKGAKTAKDYETAKQAAWDALKAPWADPVIAGVDLACPELTPRVDTDAGEEAVRADFPKVVEPEAPHRCAHGRPYLYYCCDCAAQHAANLRAMRLAESVG